jgi:DNA-binding NarL/FixJ family response regulator
MACEKRIRVMVVDDHPVVRRGLATLVEAAPDMSLVAEVGDGEQCLAVCSRRKPDVVVLDLLLPGINGIEVTRRLAESGSASQVLVLTSYSGDQYLFEILEAGARGFLLKDCPPDEILKSIRLLYRGQSALSPATARRLVDRVGHRREARCKEDVLTTREDEVLCLVAGGLSNAEIAESLFVSPATVRTHVSHILAKLHLKRRSQAVAYAFRHGLVRTVANAGMI